jgi:hypothetical protein
MSSRALASTRASLLPTLLVTDCSRQRTIGASHYRRTRYMVTNREQTMDDPLLLELLKFVKSTNTFPSIGAGNAARHRPLSSKARRLNETVFRNSRRPVYHSQQRHIEEPIQAPTQ